MDDILFAEEMPLIREVVNTIQNSHSLDTVVHGLGKFLFYGLSFTQAEDFSIEIDGDDKLISYE